MRARLRRGLVVLGAIAVLAAACSNDDGGNDSDAATSTTNRKATTTTVEVETLADAATTTTAGGDAAGVVCTEISDGVYEIEWSAVNEEPYFLFNEETPADPFWHIHNWYEADGCFFSLEMYTTYGPTWDGELGEFPIECTDTGTGICLHFTPEGGTDLGADFLATGTVNIEKLDDSGYKVTVSDAEFSDGTTIPGPTVVSG